MTSGSDSSSFDASRAELFEALGHPIRIKILHALSDGPLGFADLKRKVGIESSGHLQFHLGKLTSLVTTSVDSTYMLTDDGKEALRIVSTPKDSGFDGSRADKNVILSRTVLTGLVVGAIIVILALGSMLASFNNTISDLRAQVGSDNGTIQTLLFQRYLIFNSSNFPYNNYSFLSPPGSSCEQGGAMCGTFGAGLGDAVVFNCAAAAASANGCTQLVENSNAQSWKYYVNIKYPIALKGNQLPGLSCTFTTLADSYSYGFYCIPVNSTAFVVGIPNQGPV
jgi:DNA-binding transcriptional ArsR family regulator